jgi:hypothetical protein
MSESAEKRWFKDAVYRLLRRNEKNLRIEYVD